MESAFEIAPYLAAAAGLVVVSAFFSGTEVALFALRRIDREQMARSGRPVDAIVLTLLEKPRRLISTVLVGKEAVNALAAVVILQAVREVWTAAPWVLIGIALAIALPLVLLLGEILPKTLALKGPIGWARAAVRPLWLFSVVIAPVRWVVQGAGEVALRPFGDAVRARPSGDLSEEEFRKLVDAGSAQGQVDARERRLIHRVFEFADKNVGQIMTPRDKMFALSFDLPTARLVKEVAARGFSRVPIYQRSLDNIRGILNAKDLVVVVASAMPARRLAEMLHEPLFVPRTTPVKRLFRIFKQKKVHMALVVNEYGKVLGVVTMDDVLAQLFGKLRDEREGLQSMARRGRGGRTPVPGTPVVPEAAPPEFSEEPPGDFHDEAVSRGEDVVPVARGDEDDVTPPAIDLPLDHSLRSSEPASDPDAVPVPLTDADTGPSGPIASASPPPGSGDAATSSSSGRSGRVTGGITRGVTRGDR
jgi:putative hemolysin